MPFEVRIEVTCNRPCSSFRCLMTMIWGFLRYATPQLNVYICNGVSEIGPPKNAMHGLVGEWILLIINPCSLHGTKTLMKR